MTQTSKNKYQVCEEIGRGRFGIISRVFCPQTQSSFASKSIDKRLLADPIDRQCLENEPKIMTLLPPHSNIVQIHNMSESDHTLQLILDLCQPYTLYDKILQPPHLSEPEAASYMQQLVSGLAHCHRFGVVHRDVKPDNVFFDFRGNLKIGDFGSATWLGELGTVDGLVGTPYYVAPEIVMGRAYNEKVDVWSAGVVLYVMLAGVPPFNGETAGEIFEAVSRGNLRFPRRVFRSVSGEVKDLLRKMICRDVSKRLPAEQVLRHPWMLNGGLICCQQNPRKLHELTAALLSTESSV
ncbi:phosphoenolpyruvate carboxylase kinase 1, PHOSPHOENOLPYRUVATE CARBOXYLASE KINASE 1 [Hibiscus trionum]|uniref:Phosphoenolpyruvate carboxylase kinase 1, PHOSPHOENOLPYRUVATE CARBOXYLASE KINASE 1 n=1 Tax=Hibiscus trionum TaxID=183268 RepID=A0A9W7HXH3_HIBTR|nr:phosphoenolpyruvate carboxylase kinase 1, PHOSPHOENOLPYRUVATE CARBOXYLASE KINASE 1 [Hibiscus trionum]